MTRFLEEAPVGYLLDEAGQLLDAAKRKSYADADGAVGNLCAVVEILAALVERSLNEQSARELVEAV